MSAGDTFAVLRALALSFRLALGLPSLVILRAIAVLYFFGQAAYMRMSSNTAVKSRALRARLEERMLRAYSVPTADE